MWVGSESVSGHFTVHKVEQLNLKKRELAGVYKILRRNWSLFEFSFCVGSFYISAAWLGLLLIFFSDGGHEDYFSHEFKSWKKKGISPQTPVTLLIAGTDKQGCIQSWPVAHGISAHCFSLRNQLSGGTGCFLLIPALHLLSWFFWGSRMLANQGPLQTGAQIRTTVMFVAFRNAEDTFY